MPEAARILPDAEERRLIREALSTTMLVEAAAGTGKTTGMVGRMVGLVRTGTCDPARIAAVTFTRKAAGELRSRFQVALERGAKDESLPPEERQRLRAALERTDQCFMGTIHSFCARLLRERPVEAEVDIGFEEIDDAADRELRIAVWREWCARLLADDPAGLLDRLRERGLSLQSLAGAFVQFAEYPDITAWPAPEADKTDLEALRRRTLEQLEHMRKVLPHLPPDEGSSRWPTVYTTILRVASHLELSNDNDWMRLLESFGSKAPSYARGVKHDRELIGEERDRWNAYYDEVVTPALDALRALRYPLALEALRGAKELYDHTRARMGVLNFADLLLTTAALLRDNPAVRRYFAARFTHLLVDEFQDTDPVQAEVMMLLTADDVNETDWTKCAPRPGSLFVVGDPKQSIYRFRRADIVTYNRVKATIENLPDGKAVSLRTNFRTTGDVVDWANRCFAPRFPDTATDTAPEYVSLEVGREDGPVGDLHGVWALRNQAGARNRTEPVIEEDAAAVAHFIRHAVATGMTVTRSAGETTDGVSTAARYDDFLIVPYTKKQLPVYARKLQELGVPCRVTGGSLLGDVEEIRLLADCLRTVTAPHNPVELIGLLRGELFGISDADLYAFRKAGGVFHFREDVPPALGPDIASSFSDAFGRLRRYARWLHLLPPAVAVERITADLGLFARACAGEGGDVSAGALCKAIELLRDGQARHWTVSEIVAELQSVIDDAPDSDAPSVREDGRPVVRLMNLHKVKGLEAPVVFLVNPTGNSSHSPESHIDRSRSEPAGYLSITERFGSHGGRALAYPAGWNALAAREQDFLDAEETRLLYVAATRAKSMLVVTTREKYENLTPWRPLHSDLAEVRELAVPSAEDVTPEQAEETNLAPEQIRDAHNQPVSVRNALQTATYRVERAKAFALAQDPEPGAQGTLFAQRGGEIVTDWGEHGAEWGEVIHVLLETASVEPGCDLLPLAESLLPERGIDPDLAGNAVEITRAALASPLLQRARKSAEMRLEVPFHVVLDGVLLRGAVDLAFRDEGGWVLVDHKTDDPSRLGEDTLAARYAPQLAFYARAWTAFTEETVAECWLNFIRTGTAVQVPAGT